jgi:GMP synthase (glutamine-hydrolysing)
VIVFLYSHHHKLGMAFDPQRFIEESIPKLKEQVKGKAIIGLSGGVDSTTSAVLVNRAVGESLLCVFVDTGYMRKGEPEAMVKVAQELGLNMKTVDAKDRFYKALKGVTDPEEKRKIIGKHFIRVFEEEARADGAEYLVQGTIAPDWIESGSGIRDNIKSHHNVGGLPEKMDLKLVEPLRDLYKDEVRKVGEAVGLPESIWNRQPFPGPGLAVRIVGEATPEKATIVREACAIVEEEIERAAADGKIEAPWQYFAVLLPLRTVGVQGDVRAYGYTIAVRAVQSVDAMTAAFSRIPPEVLEKISSRITNTLKDEVTRVVFDITHKPPATIEYE